MQDGTIPDPVISMEAKIRRLIANNAYIKENHQQFHLETRNHGLHLNSYFPFDIGQREECKLHFWKNCVQYEREWKAYPVQTNPKGGGT